MLYYWIHTRYCSLTLWADNKIKCDYICTNFIPHSRVFRFAIKKKRIHFVCHMTALNDCKFNLFIYLYLQVIFSLFKALLFMKYVSVVINSKHANYTLLMV